MIFFFFPPYQRNISAAQVEQELIPVSAGTRVNAFDQLTGTMLSKCNVS